MKQHRRILSSSPPARARAAVSGPLIEEGTDTLRIADVQVPRRPVPVLAERAERDAGFAAAPSGRGQLYARDGTLLCGQ